jgi:hypothetical protein
MKFKLFVEGDAGKIEKSVNDWLTKARVSSIRSTDLAFNVVRVQGTDTEASGKQKTITRPALTLMVGVWYD